MSEKDGVFYVSFSELSVFDNCPYQHYLMYEKGMKQGDTVHTIFGGALHHAIDERLSKKSKNSWISFGKMFLKGLKENNITEDKWIPGDDKTVYSKDWLKAGFAIYDGIFQWLEDQFPNYELIGSEIDIFDPMETVKDATMKGFVDLIIKVGKKYYVLDFKTCNWGWSKEKLNDVKKKYQIRIYKHFIAKKFDIPEKDIEVGFILLKRNPSKNSSRYQFVKVTSGEKAQLNVVDWMTKKTKGIKAKQRRRNRESCKYCDFFDTEHCPLPANVKKTEK